MKHLTKKKAKKPQVVWEQKSVPKKKPSLREVQLQVIKRHYQERGYEGASKDKALLGWMLASGLDNNSDIFSSLDILITRSRDLYKNNPYGKRAINAYVDHAIGTGIKVKFKSKALTKLWEQTFETPNIDFYGIKDIFYIQESLARTSLIDGTGFAVKRACKPKKSEGQILNFKIQLLPIEHLAREYKEDFGDGKYIDNGVEFDEEGRILAYYFKKNLSPRHTDPNPIRFDAKDVIPLFKEEFLNQVLGVPFLANSMLKLRDLDDYQSAELLKQKLSATHVDYIESDIASEDDYDEPPKVQKRRPGTREVLKPGQKLVTSNPPKVGGDHFFIESIINSLAASCNIPTPILSMNFKGINYSNFKGLHAVLDKEIEKFRSYTLVARCYNKLLQWFFDWVRQERSRIRDFSYNYSYPKRDYLDPSKELPQAILAARAGIKSVQAIHREQGSSYETTLEEVKEFYEWAKKNGIVLDSIPTLTNRSGALQISYKPESENEDIEEEENVKKSA